MSEKTKVRLEILLAIVAVVSCVATCLALIPENLRWPFPTRTIPSPSPQASPTPNPWAGIIDVDPTGLDVIKGYDVWFSSLAGNRWQIWHLASQNREIKRIQFDMSAEVALLDEFVPALSPDGRQIALAVGPCVEGGPCNRDIFLANADGTNAHSLIATTCLDEFHPVWSPDSQKLAYFGGIWADPDCPNAPHGIWVYDFATGQTHQLTDKGDFDPVWSPNGKYIAYHSADPSWDIKVLDYESCGTTINSCNSWVVANVGNMATSAGWINNNTLVFTSDADGDWELYTVHLQPNQTLNPTQITDNDWDDQYPAVSTDGQIVIWQAFTYYETGDIGAATGKAAVIYVMKLSDKQATPLITGIGNARDGFLRRLP